MVILVSIGIGLCFGTYLYFTVDHQFSRIVTSVLSSLDIGSLMMLAIYYRFYFTNITDSPYFRVLIMICLLIMAAMLGSELTLFLKALIYRTPFTFFNSAGFYVLNILIALVAGIPMYVSEKWKENLNSRVVTQQFKLLQLEQQNTLFELELLRAKINPHFLYNVHNSIAGLISKDPEKAEKMVLLLSKFFRFTLNKNSATFHTIGDEIGIISTYLDLQAIRYEERLTYIIDADPAIIDLQMPSFILQPLVENAVKHGIEPISVKGSITVSILLIDKNIQLKVADTGPDFPDSPGIGMGLQTVNNKLRLLYKEDFKLNISKLPEKYVEIILPKGN